MSNHAVPAKKSNGRNPAFEKQVTKDAVKTVLEIQRRLFAEAAKHYPDSEILEKPCRFEKIKLPLSEYLPVDCDRLFLEYGLTRLLSKCAVGADRKACKLKALETSLAAERQCADTNHSLDRYRSGDFSFLPRIAWCLHDAKAELRRLFLTINEDDVVRNAAFGPGVSLGHRGLRPTKVDKLAMKVTGTPFALKLWAAEFPYYSLLTGGLLNCVSNVGDARTLLGDALYEPQPLHVVNYDEWTNVPKDRHTDRGICVSPTANIRYQKGLGVAMRQRLRNWGLDLSRQAEVNAEIARKGSLGLGFDTLDLQSASDTVSSGVVRFLFEGTDILRLMEGLRTPYTFYPCADGGEELKKLNKFSAMGNGFTFELETAIFAALIRSACRYLGLDDFAHDNSWSVFGDDICCRSEVTSLVLELLDVLGFTINEDKSFTSGYFRESCGKDWFCGVQVRPYFFKAGYLNDVTLTRLANGLRRWCSRSYGDFGLLDGRFRGCWRYVVNLIRSPIFGNTIDDDSFIMVSKYDLDMPQVRRRLTDGTHVVMVKGYGCKTRGLRGLYPDSTLYAYIMHFGRSLSDELDSYLVQSFDEYADRFRRVPCQGDALSQRWVC